MQSAHIAPDRTGARRPVHPCNAVMVPGDQSEAVVPDHLLLVAIKTIDLADVQTHARKQGLPSSDGMCSHDGVVGCELEVLVQGRATGRHDLVLAGFTG